MRFLVNDQAGIPPIVKQAACLPGYPGHEPIAAPWGIGNKMLKALVMGRGGWAAQLLNDALKVAFPPPAMEQALNQLVGGRRVVTLAAFEHIVEAGEERR